jgi:hypothetical protein
VIEQPPELPRRDDRHQVDREGVTAASHAVVFKLKWIFREQSVEDYGIDAHLEVVADDEAVTGRLIGAQAKSGESWFSEPAEGGWVFRESHRRHLNYWLGHSLPVVVILYHPARDVSYWQVVNETTAHRTDKGFKIMVPEANILDASARPALEDVARRRGQLAVAAYDRSLELLPEDACRVLRRAAEEDLTGAARLAQMLADGRSQPGMTAAQVLAAEPSWLIGSPGQADLWAATGAYANGHDHRETAAEAFLRSARLGGPQAARRRAFAGLALQTIGDRDRAREELLAAREAGATLLADVGFAYIDIPADDARLVPVPASIQAATAAQLDAEPTVLNFLAELRQRAEDYDAAVALIERAVTASQGRDGDMRLRLAEMLRRRMQARGGFGGPDSATARVHARAGLADLRRWSGPSETALEELLDLEILDGELTKAVSLALPLTAGGTALDREAAHWRIAARGATAALLTRDARALAYFRQALAGHPWLVQLDAQELETRVEDPVARQEAWLKALHAADNDSHRASCVMRLSELGVWPLPEADDMLRRSVMPEWTYRIAAAKAQAARGDVTGAMVALRVLAEEYVTAGVELVRLLDRHVTADEARREWERQYRRWQDVLLVELMLEMRRGPDRQRDADQMLLQMISDPRLAVDTRMRLRRTLIGEVANGHGWKRVVQLCQAGLAERTDDHLVWHLVAALYNQHNAPEARRVLARYEPAISTEQEARLWGQLRVGTDLTEPDAHLAAELAERYQDAPALAGGLTGLLHRELARHEREGGRRWPEALVQRVAALVRAAQGTGYGPEHITEEELRRRLRGENYQQLEQVRLEVAAGRMPLGRLAILAGRPYGQVLLQCTAGVIVASDPEPGLVAAGQTAARRALAGGSAVADLSALHLLQLLGADGRTLRAQLPDLVVTTSTAADALRSRDAVWTVTGASFTVGLEDGVLRRGELSAEQRALMRTRAEDLEEVTARLQHQQAGAGKDPTGDAVEFAAREGLPLYADDVALRQIARRRGVPAFGTTDLLAVVGYSQQQIDGMLMRLAAEYVVDLPLGGNQIVSLERDGGWRGTYGAVAISRRQWWQRAGAGWADAWGLVAGYAAQASSQALMRMTQVALQGALHQVVSGLRTQRYQEIVVTALAAAQQAGCPVPQDYLAQLAASAPLGVAPKPKYVYQALIAVLRDRGVDPEAKAATLLPHLRFDSDTWT